MNRYIFLSFLFMGWMFYELSGGADFESPSSKQAALSEPASIPKVETEYEVAELMTAKPEPAVRLETPTKLDRAAGPILASATEELIVDAGATEIPATTETVTSGIVMSSGWLTDLQDQTVSTDTVFSLASLAPLPEVTPTTASQDAIWGTRIVKGSRVNVRSGPGTDHSVVSSLTGGMEVQVLNDPGTGWIEMRHTDSETVGWMAASLLTP